MITNNKSVIKLAIAILPILPLVSSLMPMPLLLILTKGQFRDEVQQYV